MYDLIRLRGCIIISTIVLKQHRESEDSNETPRGILALLANLGVDMSGLLQFPGIRGEALGLF